MTRFAAYLRTSTDDQIGNFSLHAQHNAIEEWVKSQGGEVVELYIDEAQSALTSQRPAFQQMRRDAHQGMFDAIVVHKFDRFSRSRMDAIAIKSLLRREYNIKVFSVTEPSEDSDGPLGLLVEGLLECIADWYSQNLATETQKGKYERARQGYHNNREPFGYDKDADGLLIPNETERLGLQQAFELYATGNYSDNDIAQWLNQNGYIAKSGRPFATDTVRDILQNKIYIGKIKYRPASAKEGRAPRSQAQYFQGKHIPIIDEELFELCQQARRAKRSQNRVESGADKAIYLLSGILYCAECVANKPPELDDDSYGKMRVQIASLGNRYRCRARDFSRTCSQTSAPILDLDQQVIDFLRNFTPTAEQRHKMISEISGVIIDQKLEQRVDEIKAITEDMDFQWIYGFIANPEQYIEERYKLQQELEQLAPIADDEVAIATDIVSNFGKHWDMQIGDHKAQKELLTMVVKRVWTRDGLLTAILLRPNIYIEVT